MKTRALPTGRTAVNVPNETFADRDGQRSASDRAGPARPIDRSSRVAVRRSWRDTTHRSRSNGSISAEREVVEDAIERFARQELRREVAKEPRVALALGRALPLLDHPRDQEPDDRAPPPGTRRPPRRPARAPPGARTRGAVKKNVKPSEREHGGDHARPGSRRPPTRARPPGSRRTRRSRRPGGRSADPRAVATVDSASAMITRLRGGRPAAGMHEVANVHGTNASGFSRHLHAVGHVLHESFTPLRPTLSRHGRTSGGAPKMANSTRTEQPTGRTDARPAPASRRVLLQAAAPRPGDPDRPPDPRAPRPVHGAGHLLVGRALLRRLRHRGDAADAVHRRRGGDGRVRADHAALARDRRRAGDPDVQLPPDDQGLPVRGRRVHRHEGQLRAGAGADRGRRAADGLRAHRGGLGRRRASPPSSPRSRRCTSSACRCVCSSSR